MQEPVGRGEGSPSPGVSTQNTCGGAELGHPRGLDGPRGTQNLTPLQSRVGVLAGAAQPSAPHLVLAGVLGAGVLLRLLPAAKKAPAPLRSTPHGAGVGEPGAAWAPMGEPREGAVSPGEVLKPFGGLGANSCTCQHSDVKTAAFGFEPGCWF